MPLCVLLLDAVMHMGYVFLSSKVLSPPLSCLISLVVVLASSRLVVFSWERDVLFCHMWCTSLIPFGCIYDTLAWLWVILRDGMVIHLVCYSWFDNGLTWNLWSLTVFLCDDMVEIWLSMIYLMMYETTRAMISLYEMCGCAAPRPQHQRTARPH